MRSYLDFEKPVAELEAKIEELRAMQADGDAVAISEEINRIEGKAEQALKELYGGLTPWQKTQVARHPQRPHCLDYVARADRRFRAARRRPQLWRRRRHHRRVRPFPRRERLRHRPRERLRHRQPPQAQFRHGAAGGLPQGGAAHGHGRPFRASRSSRSIDTAGAYPGIGAEERGQAEAIARSTEACLRIGVPNVATIIGEGGSGGAIAVATANRVLMLEHAIYSVISPEGAASILWRDTAKAQEAASNMKITAQDLVRFGVVDTIVPEPTGGAHRDPAAAIVATGEAIGAALAELQGLDPATIVRLRREKFMAIGRVLS